MIKYVDGDLVEMALDGQFDVIGHCCNCFNSFGAGIAKTIRDKMPFAYNADKRTKAGDKAKLGTFTIGEENGLVVANLYGQYGYGRDMVNVEYPALKSALDKLKDRFSGKRFGFNQLGCGLAGGDWSVVERIIENVFEGEDVTVVIYKPR